jgi:two-component system, chemotaxis family, chemotaxis protein CheY
MPQASPKKRVLIADDVHETRRNTRVMLSMIESIEVVAIAMNGAQAVEMAREYKPDFVVMDINMPELNGLAAFKKMSQENPKLACIIISAERDSGTFRQAASIGIKNYLIKPFNTDELEKAVQDVIHRLDHPEDYPPTVDVSLEKNENYLRQLADEYTKDKRTDDKAIEVFEEVINLPNCELRWIQTLAMIYTIRQKWGKLKQLAEQIEQRNITF